MLTDTEKRELIAEKLGQLPFVLTPADVEKVLSLSRNTVYELFHSEGFPAMRLGKQYRVQLDKLLAWLDAKAEAEAA